MNRVSCFTLSVDDVTAREAQQLVTQWLQERQQHYIVTPNPEMVMLAKHDQTFRQAVNDADLLLADGFGLVHALRLLGYRLKERITGTDFFQTLLALEQKPRIFFLGATNEVVSIARQNAEEKFEANIVGTFCPPKGTYACDIDLQVKKIKIHEELLRSINKAKPELLVVALGHGQQEKWMHSMLKLCPTVKVAIGVGGAFDYLSGRVSRAPHLVRHIGFEWLWRGFRQPWRIPRLLRATVLFPIETFRWWWTGKFRYRPIVVACVLNQKNEVLLVERKQEVGHWQFPQGGVEQGEPLKHAILRELFEETSMKEVRLLGRTKRNVYRYRWPRGPVTTNRDALSALRRHYGFAGQRATMFFLRFNGSDDSIQVDERELRNWQWVPQEQLLSVMHPVRQRSGTVALQWLHQMTRQR